MQDLSSLHNAWNQRRLFRIQLIWAKHTVQTVWSWIAMLICQTCSTAMPIPLQRRSRMRAAIGASRTRTRPRPSLRPHHRARSIRSLNYRRAAKIGPRCTQRPCEMLPLSRPAASTTGRLARRALRTSPSTPRPRVRCQPKAQRWLRAGHISRR